MMRTINTMRILLNLFIPQRRKPKALHAIPEAEKDLSGKTLVFTGGTDGIGRVTVEMFYKMGASVVLLGRNEAKGETVIRELTTSGGQGEVSFQICDLSSMNSVKSCAERILVEHKQIDVLVNCAGLTIMNKRILTDEGFEASWAVNYLGPYLLTRLLLGRIQESAASRIVNLTTNFDFVEPKDYDNIKTVNHFDTANSYGDAKLWMNIFTVDLAQKLEGTGISANYLYPGYIKSNLLGNLEGPAKMMQFFMRVMASPTEVGADRIVRLAVSSEYHDVSGAYVSMDTIKTKYPEAQAEKREQLMQTTENALSKWL